MQLPQTHGEQGRGDTGNECKTCKHLRVNQSATSTDLRVQEGEEFFVQGIVVVTPRECERRRARRMPLERVLFSCDGRVLYEVLQNTIIHVLRGPLGP